MRFTAPKYGFKEFERNIYFNLFIIIQITAVLILMVYSVSSISYISKFYNPIKDYIDGCGICTNEIPNYQTLKEVEENDYIDSIYSYETMGGFVNDNDAFYNENYINAMVNSYDDDFINDFEPLIEKGIWLDECDIEDDGCINAVISYTSEYNVGDICKVVFDPDDPELKEEIKFKIVGMLSDGAKVFNSYEVSSSIKDAASLYRNYYAAEHKDEFLFITRNSDKLKGFPGISLVKFKDSNSEEDIEGIYAELGMNYDISSIVRLEDINKESLKSINEQKIMMIPLIIGITILIIVSIFSMSAISSNKQLKNYGIYTASGATKLNCIFIQMWNVFYICILSSILAFVIYKIMIITGILSSSIVSFGTNELFVCIAMILMAVIASAVMPAIIIGKTESKEMLKEEES